MSWDDAFSLVAGELSRVKQQYGPSAVLAIGGSITSGILHANNVWSMRPYTEWSGGWGFHFFGLYGGATVPNGETDCTAGGRGAIRLGLWMCVPVNKQHRRYRSEQQTGHSLGT